MIESKIIATPICDLHSLNYHFLILFLIFLDSAEVLGPRSFVTSADIFIPNLLVFIEALETCIYLNSIEIVRWTTLVCNYAVRTD